LTENRQKTPDLRHPSSERKFSRRATRRSHSERALKDIDDLTKPIREELEKFFIATDELEDKKLNIIGWKGPKAALQAIKDAAKAFAKDDK